MIRDANRADAQAIAQIWNAIIRDTAITFSSTEKSLAEIETRIETGPVLILEDQGAVIGFATFGPFRSGSGYKDAAEHTIYLAGTSTGKGKGAALMQALEERARHIGLRHLIAGIAGSNMQARQFHAKRGFQEVGHLPGIGIKFGRLHDLVLMMKKL